MSTRILIRANVSRSVLLDAYRIATDFEARYSAYRQDSWLNEVNHQAGISPVKCTKEDHRLLSLAIDIGHATQGAFDITIGALSHTAYGFGFAHQKLPKTTSVRQAKRLVNYQNIELTSDTVFLRRKGMRLDLGGIGKGYVAQRIAHFLYQSGAEKYLVDVGGEIITYGKRYTIALKKPFSDYFWGVIETDIIPTSISTSGTYERYIDRENHHILDRRLGRSPEYYSSLTLMINGIDLARLDAYATALFMMHPKKAKHFADQNRIALLALDTAGRLIIDSSSTLKCRRIRNFGTSRN